MLLTLGDQGTSGPLQLFLTGHTARKPKAKADASLHPQRARTGFPSLAQGRRDDGAWVKGLVEWFDLTREQVTAVLDLASRASKYFEPA